MFDTMQEINRNPYINDLVNSAKSFDIYGEYVEYKDSKDPNHNGIYFISSYNPQIIRNLDIESLYQEQISSSVVRMDLHITKLTDQSPFNAHQDVMNYCLHASTIRAISNKVGFDNELKYLSPSFISLVEVTYLAATNEKASKFDRLKNELILKDFFHKEGKKELLTNGDTKDHHSIHMRPEKIDKTIPNMVCIEELAHETKSINKIIVSYDMLARFKNELKKRPDILFFQAKPVVTKLNVKDSEGFGSKEKNRITSVIFLYDAKYSKEIELMYLKTKYPQCFRNSVEDIKNQGGGLCSFGLGMIQLENIFQLAEEHNIPICIDTQKLYFNGDKNYSAPSNIAGYTITIPLDRIEEMNEILYREASKSKTNRILTQEDCRQYSHNVERPTPSFSPNIFSDFDER